MSRGREIIENILFELIMCNDAEYKFITIIFQHCGIKMPDINTFKDRISELDLDSPVGMCIIEMFNQIAQINNPYSKEELEREQMEQTISALLKSNEQRTKFRQN